MNESRAPARKPAKKSPVSKAIKSGKSSATASSGTAGYKLRAVPPALRTVEAALSDMKAVDVKVLDVRGMSDITDFMVIASGTSDRHLRSIADRVVQMAKASGQRPLGVEGERQGEWILVDLPEIMVHIMLPRTREFYQLEHLWESRSPLPRNSSAGGKRASAARG
ncbi:MAG: ribosome silencing factor [Gammaproteobacteria bacterium]|nr:ribosome silencing factor [Gammaproteobacteria bacterium]